MMEETRREGMDDKVQKFRSSEVHIVRKNFFLERFIDALLKRKKLLRILLDISI